MQLKRGYENGEQAIEIYEGKIDVILYNNKPNVNFYFYRFDSEDIFGEKLKRDVHLIYKHEVVSFLSDKGINYDDLIEHLVVLATKLGMKERYDM